MPEDTQQLIASRYQLLRRIGAGGMGEVWEAEDTVLGRRVAVKVVDLARTGDRRREEIRERAMREGRAAAQIDHPRTVRVFDIVDDPDHLYLVMELVSATQLDDAIRDDGPLEPRAAAQVGLQVVEALAAAHRAGVVHRDVKPGNVMVLADGSVKLADFGIATIKEDPDLTATGLVMGTPKFLSPEAARGERATAASDLWGLGALLHFVVEGEAPFDKGDTLPTLHAVLHEPPRPSRLAGPLAPVIAALLTKDPAGRPSVEETARLLRAVIAGEDATVATVVSPAPTATQVLGSTRPVQPAPAAREPVRAAPRPASAPARAGNGGRLLAGLAALALLIGIGAIALAQSQGDDDPGTTTETTVAPTETTAAPPEDESTTTTESPTTTASLLPDLERPDGVPETWVPYEGDGYRIWHPIDWVRNGSDFTAPDGSYLRVDSVSPPSADGDPVKAWEQQEKAFEKDHPDYERIRLEETDYRDYEAAIWEFTFSGQHADDLGFVVGDTGYALNFVTDEGAWDDYEDVREAFKAGFEPTA